MKHVHIWSDSSGIPSIIRRDPDNALGGAPTAESVYTFTFRDGMVELTFHEAEQMARALMHDVAHGPRSAEVSQ